MTDTNKTPNCNMHEALVSYLYNEATAEESRRVESHIAECRACAEEMAAFERVRGMLQQWQLDDMPIVRVVASPPRRSALAVLKELFSITPLWAKALGAMAMAMLVLAVMGTEISVGRDGFSMRADLLRRNQPAQAVSAGDTRIADNAMSSVNVEQVRADLRAYVNDLILASERQQKEELNAQLVSLESQLQNMHAADLAKLATRIQEHQARLKTIERDIDRREGSDLTDILFSDVLSKPDARSNVLAEKGSD
ncbi:MAG TPA: zf-HC2 domain-containing protein [Blastocatellia bacterium]|nr:zf-HC2 domain-containing protein [Blastocatellia bacterium]